MTPGSDILQKVKPGAPPRIPARTFNAFVDAAIDHQHRQRSSQTTAPPRSMAGDASPNAGNVVLIRNDSGQDRQRFEILGIDAPVFLPADHLEEFQRQIALACVVPVLDEHADRFVILSEPVRAGAIGRAWAGGVCPVQVAVDDETFMFAELQDGDATALKAASSGPITILWIDAGTGIKWAIVRFGSAPAAGLVPVKVWRDGGTTDGSKTQQCNRTYRVRTIDATGPSTGGALLGTNLAPKKRRPVRGKLSVPSNLGAGETGTGYFNGPDFVLYDANETLDVEACD